MAITLTYLYYQPKQLKFYKTLSLPQSKHYLDLCPFYEFPNDKILDSSTNTRFNGYIKM